MISYEYVQFLREKLTQYMPRSFHKVGGKYNGRCIFCGDSKKSASKKRGWIYFNKDCSYYCFNCGISMSGIKLLQHLSGDDYQTLRKEYLHLFLKSGISSSLSAEVDADKKAENIFNVKPIVDPSWKNPLSEKALQYLDSRKVLDAPFLSDQLYSCYNSKTSEEFILIPWKMNGVDAYYQINDFQHLHPMKYIFPKDQKKLVGGIDNIDVSWNKIIVFEGFYDSVFVKNGVCAGTKGITDYQLSLLRQRYPRHQIVIAFDNDEAGLQAVGKLLRDPSKQDFKYFKWFSDSTKEKDINEIVLSSGDPMMFSDEKKLESMIVDRLSMKLFLIKKHLWSL